LTRRDYFVENDWGDVLNVEAFPTFKQARDFLMMIKPQVNQITSLEIWSEPRGTNYDKLYKKENSSGMDKDDFKEIDY
jgi:hypothetical protein